MQLRVEAVLETYHETSNQFFLCKNVPQIVESFEITAF